MITIEDLIIFKNNCESLSDQNKVLRFTDCYIDPDIVKNGLETLINKINRTSFGLDVMNDSDKLLLMLINEQKGSLF